MAKRKNRIQNPVPFCPDGNDPVVSRKRNKAPKRHAKEEEEEDELVPPSLSAKIVKESLLQQKEIEKEDAGPHIDENPYAEIRDPDDEKQSQDEDIDDFLGYDDTQTEFGNYNEDYDEEDEILLEQFLSKETGPQRTLADIMAEKIKTTEVNVHVPSEIRPLPKLETTITELYKGVGALLSKYTAGKMPKAFKHIPSMQLWEDVLYMTEPENWSPNAMYQATRIFSSNLNSKKAQHFYNLVLLPRVREDIKKMKRLHFALYQSLKKSLYKPAAFFKGILFPLCESQTCSLREAVIMGSVIQKVSIPPLHSSVALLKLAEMEYYGTTSYFIKLLVEKKYALPYRVVDAMVAHFMRFIDDPRTMPVIWHQSLLAFVQRYKNELQKEDKDNLRLLLEKQKHKLVTPEILRELNNSRNRGEKEDDVTMTNQPAFVINKPIEEDRFDIPDVPMEED